MNATTMAITHNLEILEVNLGSLIRTDEPVLTFENQAGFELTFESEEDQQISLAVHGELQPVPHRWIIQRKGGLIAAGEYGVHWIDNPRSGVWQFQPGESQNYVLVCQYFQDGEWRTPEVTRMTARAFERGETLTYEMKDHAGDADFVNFQAVLYIEAAQRS